jgi:hypothetical protein
MTRSRWFGAFALLAVPLGVAAVGASGCAANDAGGAAPAAPATQDFEKSRTAGEPEPATIEDAQAQLERARAALAGWAPGAGPAGTATGTTQDLEQKKTEATAGGEPAGAREGDRCTTACSAMASMKRAVDAICRMAGDADARCTSARKTADESQAKVVGCGC